MGLKMLTLALDEGPRAAAAAALGSDAEWGHVDDAASCRRAVASERYDAMLLSDAIADVDAGSLLAELRRVDRHMVVVVLGAEASLESRALTLGADFALVEDSLDELGDKLRSASEARMSARRDPAAALVRRVLVAGGHEAGFADAAQALARAGYEVVTASRAEQALHVLRDHAIHVLVTTEGIAGMSGRALFDAAWRYDASIAGVMAVPLEQLDAGLQALRAGASSMLSYASAPAVLVERVDQAWNDWVTGSGTLRRRGHEGIERLALLLVDARPKLAKRMRKLLHEAGRGGWSLEVANSEHEAVARLEQGQVDLLIFAADGDAALDRFATLLARAPSLAALALAPDDDRLAARLLGCGALDVLPDQRLAASQLVGRVEHAMRRHQLGVLLDEVVRDGLARRKRADQQTRELQEQLAQARQDLARMGSVDPLTEVLNRHGLEAALSRELESARRSGGNIVACLVDCDDFDAINHSLGHAAGDQVLSRVTERVASALRKTDTIGRIGGDEFLLLLPQTRMAEALMVAERARLAVAATPIDVADGERRVAVSIGVASVPWGANGLEEVLPLTRMALNVSKQSGRNKLVGADQREGAEPAIDDVVRRLVDGVGLRALAQPIVRVADEKVVGYEMLTRGQAGLFEAPDQFLRVARDQGILTTVDLHCLRVCLQEMSGVPADVQVHLNLFPTTLLDLPVDELVRLFDDRGGAPLCLELSEEQFVGDPRALLERIAALRSSGVRLAIDDVGKGRGTLDSVMLLEPDVVKIDKELISGAYRDIRKERLLRRLVTLCNALRCEVVGEGVEQPNDLSLLRELDVPYAQGFLWSRPRQLAEF
jgi:diguanylate cyclase (GGDEF)-like protein